MQRVITYLENINLRSEYIYFLIAATLFIFIGLFVARLAKLYLPKLSYGLIIMTIWSLTIIYAFTLDFFKISPLIYYLLSVSTVVFFVIYTKAKKGFKWKELALSSDTRYLLKLFVVWCLGMALLLAPLFLVFEKGTVIPTRIISSDSVIHSVLSKGEAYTQQIGVHSFIENYPRGFQSFTYYSNSILNIDIKLLLLPILALGYSFMIFFVEDLVRHKKYIKGLGKLLVMLLPFSSFLIIFTFYALFVSQIAAIPILLTCLNLIFKKDISGKLKLALFIIFAVATLNVYGIFAVNVIAVGVFFYLVNYIYQKYKKKENLLKEAKELYTNIVKDNKFLLGLIAGLVLMIPSIYNGILTSVSALSNSNIILQGKGNLVEFLSPFHLTGLWSPGIEYREVLPSVFETVLMFVLITQLFFILKVKLSKNIYAVFAVLAFIMALGTFGFHNVYIHFKYLTYLTPFFIVIFGVSLIKFFDGFKLSFISKLILILFIVVSAITSAISLNRVAPATEKYFATINEIKVDYLDKYKVMLFSEDAWFRYYTSEDYDDFQPMDEFIYPNRKYDANTDQKFDYIIEDTLFGVDKDIKDFMDKTPKIKSLVDGTPEKCIQTTDRFIIYNLKCD